MHTGNQSSMKHSQKFDTGGSALILFARFELAFGGTALFPPSADFYSVTKAELWSLTKVSLIIKSVRNN